MSLYILIKPLKCGSTNPLGLTKLSIIHKKMTYIISNLNKEKQVNCSSLRDKISLFIIRKRLNGSYSASNIGEHSFNHNPWIPMECVGQHGQNYDEHNKFNNKVASQTVHIKINTNKNGW